MFERLATFEWFWQIGDAALQEAVRLGGVWLIKREITRKRTQQLWPKLSPRELSEHSPTFDAGLRYWDNLAHILTSAFEQTQSWRMERLFSFRARRTSTWI